MGQSAGAHLSALAVLEQAKRGAQHRSASSGPLGAPLRSSSRASSRAPPKWKVQDLARWVGVSGPYDIMEFVPQVKKNGLPKRVMSALMERDYAHFSPIRRVRDLSIADPLGVIQTLPPSYLFHGTADVTVGWHQSDAYAEILRKALAEVYTKYYDGKSHTDPILEDPCEGDGDELMSDLLKLVSPETSSQCVKFWRTQPKLLLKLAKRCNPF